MATLHGRRLTSKSLKRFGCRSWTLIEPCASPRNRISGAFSKKSVTCGWRR